MGQVLPNLFGVRSHALVGMPAPALGAIPYADSATDFTNLAPPTGARQFVFSQTGTGAAGAVPAWNSHLTLTAPTAADVPLTLSGTTFQTGVMSQLKGMTTGTPTLREQVDLDSAWATSTDASRKATFIGRVWDTASREFMRAESNGTTAQVFIGGGSTFVHGTYNGALTVFKSGATYLDSHVRLRQGGDASQDGYIYVSGGTPTIRVADLTADGGVWVRSQYELFGVSGNTSSGYTSVWVNGQLAAAFWGFGGDAGNKGRLHLGSRSTNDDPYFEGCTLLVGPVYNAGISPLKLRGWASQTGVMLQLQGLSSTATARAQVDIDSAWATDTDASRKARFLLRVWDTAARECVRAEASGTEAMLGFYGVSATARQLLATGAGATVDQVITALQTLGLLKQS